jgi:hypothetical protein
MKKYTKRSVKYISFVNVANKISYLQGSLISLSMRRRRRRRRKRRWRDTDMSACLLQS